jgi:hypothetical protein
MITGVLILAAVAYVLVRALMAPSRFRYVRSVRIKAAPHKVFPLVNDFHHWEGWSPWLGIDAELKRTYEGAPCGVGAIYSWEGQKTGIGRMEITDAAQDRLVKIKLDVFKPFEAHNTAEFIFEPLNDIDLGHVTAVTWSMYGPSAFMSKVMGVFMNFEQMIGKDFDRGLAQLKALAEG